MQRLRLLRNIRLGVKTLWLHKLRSALTMLGVVCGVGSVVAMLAVGEGASKEALEQITKLGSHNIIVRSVKPVEDEDTGGQRSRMTIYGLLYDDVNRIEASFAQATTVVPAKVVRKDSRVGSRIQELRIVGTTPDWFRLVDRPVVAGRVLNEMDLKREANVAVLTESGARRVLGGHNTLGEKIRFGGDTFEIVGIIQTPQGQGQVQTPDEEFDAYVPINVARKRFGDVVTRRSAGGRERELVELHQLIVEVNSLEAVEPVAAGLQAMFERFHSRDDYQIQVPLALLRQAEATKRTFNIVLGSIAGISLLVGGIGIMNIMLASVTERTREIGVRRAIGAKRHQIVGQFLTETVTLSVTGGLIGTAIGFIVPAVIERFAGLPTVVTPWSVVLALTISVLIGIVFGLYPAIRAANLDPIVALRHE